MDVIKKMLPGTNGTRRFLKLFGDRLVCVRCRADRNSGQRITTAELIADSDWLREGPTATRLAQVQHPAKQALIHIAYPENELRQVVKKAGGEWQPDRRVWRLSWREISRLGLQDRVIKP